MSGISEEPCWSGPVVVGVGQDIDDRLLASAAAQAVDRRATVRLVHVRHEPIAVYGTADIAVPVLEMESREYALGRLAKARDRMLSLTHSGEGPVSVELHVEDGDIALGILRHSRGASTILIGIDDSSGQFLIGRTALAIAARSTAPLIVMRGADRDGPVVIALSPEGLSPAAIAAAFQEADRRGAVVRAIRVLEYPSPNLPVATGAAARDEADIAELLAGHAAQWPDVRVEVSIHVGAVKRVLADASAQAALLVVGTNARGPVTGALLGSTAVEMIHRAHCPVMLLPART